VVPYLEPGTVTALFTLRRALGVFETIRALNGFYDGSVMDKRG
jgi:hypothetical protein